MSHFNICVLVPLLESAPESGGLNTLLQRYETTIEKMLEPYDNNLQVDIHKSYLSAEEVSQMSKHYNIPFSDFDALAERMPDWKGGHEGGADAQGMYELTTQNPKGYFDYWHMLGYVDSEAYEQKILGFGTGTLIAALITPDHGWIQGPFFYTHPSSQREKDVLREWDIGVRTLLKEYEDHAAFLIDCHI